MPLTMSPRLITTLVLTLALALAAALGPSTAGAAPRRVVALTPFTANTAALLGVRPVAIGAVLGGNDRFVSSLRGVPRLTLSHPNGPNVEQLARIDPDLVLSAPIWRRGETGMRRIGARVVSSEPTSVAGVLSETTRIGALLGRERAASRRVATLRREIASATRGIKRRPRVLVVLGVGRASYAFLPGSWGGDVVRAAGGRLVTDGLRARSGFARLSDEAVVARNPDVIIAVPHGTPSSISRLAREMRNRPGWRRTKAARTGRVYVSTGNSLLQAWTDVGRTIRDIRRSFLRN